MASVNQSEKMFFNHKCRIGDTVRRDSMSQFDRQSFDNHVFWRCHMKTSVCGLIIISLVIVGCARRSPTADTVTAQAQGILDAMADSIRVNGLMGWMPFLHNNPQFSWGFNGVSVTYDSLLAGERREAPLYRSITLTWDSVKAKSLGENAMHVSAKFSETLVMTAGGDTTIRGRVDCELERIEGAWKFTRGKTFDY
jgi:hypothetical protein